MGSSPEQKENLKDGAHTVQLIMSATIRKALGVT
jgi:hypothetical protein